MKYKIGTKFKKIGGDYQFEGIVVAAFTKLGGQVRYVGENKDGLLFIFNESSMHVEESQGGFIACTGENMLDY